MDQGTGPTIGDRIKQLRTGRLTQAGLAKAAGVSVHLIQALEQNKRHSLQIASLHGIARALDVDAGDLLPKIPTATPRPDPSAGAVALRQALTQVNDLIGEEPDLEPLSVEAGRQAVRDAWMAYWAGRSHDQLPQMLPATLGHARATISAASTTERAEAAEIASQLYQIAGCTLVQLGYLDSAHLAFREALTLAEQGEDELLPLALRGWVAWMLLSQGRFTESTKVATAAAAAVRPTGTSPIQAWTVYGSLLLSGARQCGHFGVNVDASCPLVTAGASVWALTCCFVSVGIAR